MVDAKRECNKIWLEKSGLQETAQQIKEATDRQQSTTFRQQQGNSSCNETDVTTNTAKNIYDTKAIPSIKVIQTTKGTYGDN
jgi:hypothetical protein